MAASQPCLPLTQPPRGPPPCPHEGDALSIVRILCYTKKFSAAEEEVERLGDPAAAFHLARQYEAQEQVAEAIKYYTQVQCSAWSYWAGTTAAS